ncbi:MAG: TlpA disulfide reductase family protein [Nocardioidaceae bacterium]
MGTSNRRTPERGTRRPARAGRRRVRRLLDLPGVVGYITADGVVEQIEAADRREMPPFEGDTLDGGHFDTDEHARAVRVINVWGSWCPPCREEAPALQRVWEETRDRGVQFIGLNIRDNDAAAVAFEREFGITYPSITTADSAPHC